ncbi:hypothetical protein [Nereida sp. NH-UV-3]|uniref:hypothetical protein n=1 Tax=Nereida sp. NH-UV-3 TaxID=3065670 RepID=UPI0036F3F851
MFSWKALSQTNFLFKHLYEYNGIAEQIAQYGPQNRNRTGFETTTKEERAIVFGEIVKSVNNDGLGLEKNYISLP